MRDRIRPSVVLLAAPESSPSVLYGLYDVLLSVGAAYPDMPPGQAEECLPDVKIAAARDQPFRCFGNVLVEPHVTIDDVAKTDVAIVCDVYTAIDTPPH